MTILLTSETFGKIFRAHPMGVSGEGHLRKNRPRVSIAGGKK